MAIITPTALSDEKLQEFKDATAAYVEDMNNIAIGFTDTVEALQTAYRDQLITNTQSMADAATARTQQYLEQIKVILQEEEVL